MAPDRDRRRARQERLAQGYARGRERDAAARAALVPLAPGERPRAVTVAVAVAVALALANLALWLGGYRSESAGSATTAPLFAAVMAVLAIGMWRCNYLAVLGFQALLAIAIVVAALSLLLASNITAVALCLAIIAAAGPLFWFLIGAMARIQAPRRPEVG